MAETRSGKNRKSKVAKAVTGIVLFIVIALALVLFLRSGKVSAGGQTLDKNSLRIELSQSGIGDVSPLLKLKNPEYIDLRGCPISPEDYRVLAASFPDCEIHWDVPLGAEGERFYNFSERLVVSSFSANSAENYVLMPCLKEIDLREAQLSAEDYRILRSRLPDCRIIWCIPIGENRLDSTLAAFTVGDIQEDELELFRLFENLETLSCTGSSFEQYMELSRMLPNCELSWSVPLGGAEYDCRTDSLSLPSSTDADELISLLPFFMGLRELDLRSCAFSAEELLAVKEASPDTKILANIELHGKSCSSDDEEIDFSGIAIDSTETLEKVLPLFHNLKKVIMCDCGISDEEMDALNLRHENISFVWTVRFSVYAVRSDTRAFCASNVAGFVAPRLGDSQLYPIRYLRDLEALDLGHIQYTDLSFLENMPHLRYLILVEANYRDISPIASLQELYYLELFNNKIDDISPLAQCRNLRHLNIGYTRGYDTTPLAEMNWLERLWCPGGVLSDEQGSALEAALPDTELYYPIWDGDGSTGGGWREHESYYQMRDALAMHYMPGGTGVPGKE
ncbi:MAG: leucine-rich repeat domain-containing protein [Ruminococcaceae bacterium]|nr:leucine-rich repeat domain-containing protein [Oscillospiraceae bacterium]